MKVHDEDRAEYNVPKTSNDDSIIRQALEILERRLGQPAEIISKPETAVDFLRLKYAAKAQEHFGLIFLNAKNGIIKHEIISIGTVDQTAVYPREIARAALEYNAVSVILFHNHPSGDPAPSAHDTRLTRTLNDTLKMLSIKVHDHLIIGARSYYSFAENGGI